MYLEARSPSYALGYYDRDNRFYKAWDGIARDRNTFMQWMQRHIMKTVDFAEFRRTLGRTPTGISARDAGFLYDQ